jgi:hypothetical protein
MAKSDTRPRPTTDQVAHQRPAVLEHPLPAAVDDRVRRPLQAEVVEQPLEALRQRDALRRPAVQQRDLLAVAVDLRRAPAVTPAITPRPSRTDSAGGAFLKGRAEMARRGPASSARGARTRAAGPRRSPRPACRRARPPERPRIKRGRAWRASTRHAARGQQSGGVVACWAPPARALGGPPCA